MSDEKLKITRRGFVKGAGVLTGAAALLGDTLEASAAAGQARKLGPGAVPIELTVNGERHRLAVEPRTTLASVLRDDLGLTRSEEHTSELQSRSDLVCRLLLEKKKKQGKNATKQTKKKQMKQ